MNPADFQVHFEFPEMKPTERLRELILYISRLSEHDRSFGKVKLAKLLYFADFTSYWRFGEPVTGTTYIKMPQGPVPKTFSSLLNDMNDKDEIGIRDEQVYDYVQQRVIALRDADLTAFSGRDIALVHEVYKQYRGRTARNISEMSHGQAWKDAELNEPIPYEASLLSDEGITEEDIEHVKRLLEIYGDKP